VCILIFNKIVLSTYRFNFPVLMTLFHMLVCVFVLSALRKGNLLSYSSFDWSLARRAIPLSFCFVANIIIGMMALRNTDIPMFATLRRLTVMFVICNEYFLLNKKPTLLIVMAVLVMIVGSLIGGWGDLHFDPLGYFFVILNNCITALYLVWMKRTFNETKLQHDQFGVMYYNSLLAIPPLIIIALLNGESTRVLTFPYLSSPGFQLSFAISALMSFLMNYSIFWCTSLNSALTTSVTGQVKNVLSSFVSVFAFGVQATPALIGGLSVGLSGSFMYAFAMYQADQKAKREKAMKTKDKEEGVVTLEDEDVKEEEEGLISGDMSQVTSPTNAALEGEPSVYHHLLMNDPSASPATQPYHRREGGGE
jgi:solute carrier family 35 protein